LTFLDPKTDSIPDDAVRSARTLKEFQLNDNNLKATFDNKKFRLIPQNKNLKKILKNLKEILKNF